MAKVITHYTLVSGSGPVLVSKVEQLLEEGWLPYFGPIWQVSEQGETITQAMVLKDEEEEN